MSVNDLLTSPEGKTLKFKRDLSSPKPILKTLVAFANTAGGTLIIGRDIAEYPAVAIREVLMNALAHADYGRSGMRIMISIFSDRLEIQSQGALPFGMTLDDFKAGVSHVRNIVVSRVLHELGLMEQWGNGYQHIINACRQGGYPEPEWREMASS